MSEERRVCFDNDLKIEAYQFNGIMQKFPNHFHNYYVIGFIESGKRHLSCKNKDYIIEPGDLMLFNPRDNHACEQIGVEALDYRCINIKEEVMKRLIDEICGKEYLPEFFQTVVFHCEYVPLLKEVHELIINKSVDFEKEEKLLFLIELLINKYANLICKSYEDNNKFIAKVCNFIEKNYFKSIKLDELSEIADMNKYSLLRVFTKTRGITPYQYLQTIRIDKAKGFLEDGQEVIDVALKTGFTDQSHFTNFFKKFIGLTPGQYRDIFKQQILLGCYEKIA